MDCAALEASIKPAAYPLTSHVPHSTLLGRGRLQQPPLQLQPPQYMYSASSVRPGPEITPATPEGCSFPYQGEYAHHTINIMPDCNHLAPGPVATSVGQGHAAKLWDLQQQLAAAQQAAQQAQQHASLLELHMGAAQQTVADKHSKLFSLRASALSVASVSASQQAAMTHELHVLQRDTAAASQQLDKLKQQLKAAQHQVQMRQCEAHRLLQQLQMQQDAQRASHYQQQQQQLSHSSQQPPFALAPLLKPAATQVPEVAAGPAGLGLADAAPRLGLPTRCDSPKVASMVAAAAALKTAASSRGSSGSDDVANTPTADQAAASGHVSPRAASDRSTSTPALAGSSDGSGPSLPGLRLSSADRPVAFFISSGSWEGTWGGSPAATKAPQAAGNRRYSSCATTKAPSSNSGGRGDATSRNKGSSCSSTGLRTVRAGTTATTNRMVTPLTAALRQPTVPTTQGNNVFASGTNRLTGSSRPAVSTPTTASRSAGSASLHSLRSSSQASSSLQVPGSRNSATKYHYSGRVLPAVSSSNAPGASTDNQTDGSKAGVLPSKTVKSSTIVSPFAAPAVQQQPGSPTGSHWAAQSGFEARRAAYLNSSQAGGLAKGPWQLGVPQRGSRRRPGDLAPHIAKLRATHDGVMAEWRQLNSTLTRGRPPVARA